MIEIYTKACADINREDIGLILRRVLKIKWEDVILIQFLPSKKQLTIKYYTYARKR